MLRENVFRKFFGIFCRGINTKRIIICIMILIMMYFTFISPLVRYSHPERIFTVFDNLFSHIKSLATDAIMRYFNIKSFRNELQKVMTHLAEGQMKGVRDVAIKLSIHPTSTPKADTTTPALTSQLHRSQNLPQLHLRRNGRLTPHHRPSAPSQGTPQKIGSILTESCGAERGVSNQVGTRRNMPTRPQAGWRAKCVQVRCGTVGTTGIIWTAVGRW
jgi:hypothetical protein